MRDIGKRLNTIEKRLKPGRELKVDPPIISGHCGRWPTAQDEHKLGPKESWLTYQQQLKAQEKVNSEYLKDHPGCLPNTIKIELDVDKEYRARQGERVYE